MRWVLQHFEIFRGLKRVLKFVKIIQSFLTFYWIKLNARKLTVEVDGCERYEFVAAGHAWQED